MSAILSSAFGGRERRGGLRECAQSGRSKAASCRKAAAAGEQYESKIAQCLYSPLSAVVVVVM